MVVVLWWWSVVVVRGGGPWWWSVVAVVVGRGGGGGGGGGGRRGATIHRPCKKLKDTVEGLGGLGFWGFTGFGPKPDTKHPNPQNLKGFGFRFSLGFRLGVLGFGFRVLKIRVV